MTWHYTRCLAFSDRQDALPPESGSGRCSITHRLKYGNTL
jgi:hypothetical protein